MATKPTPGGSDGTYGTELNAFLEISLAADGKILDGAVFSTSAAPTVDAGVSNKKYIDDKFTALTGDNESAGTYTVGNMKMEWGRETGVSGTSTTVTFTSSFFTKVFKVFPIGNSFGSGVTENMVVPVGFTNVSAIVRHDESENTSFDWFAIGR